MWTIWKKCQLRIYVKHDSLLRFSLNTREPNDITQTSPVSKPIFTKLWSGRQRFVKNSYTKFVKLVRSIRSLTLSHRQGRPFFLVLCRNDLAWVGQTKSSKTTSSKQGYEPRVTKMQAARFCVCIWTETGSLCDCFVALSFLHVNANIIPSITKRSYFSKFLSIHRLQ